MMNTGPVSLDNSLCSMSHNRAVTHIEYLNLGRITAYLDEIMCIINNILI